MNVGQVVVEDGFKWHCWHLEEYGLLRVSPEALTDYSQDLDGHARFAFENCPHSMSGGWKVGDLVIFRWMCGGMDTVTIDTTYGQNFLRGCVLVASDGQNRVQ